MKHHSADMIKNDFEETLEQSHVGFFKTKLNGKIMYANKAVLQIFGYKTQKALREKNFAHIYRDKAVGQKIIEIIIRQNGTGEKIIAELKRKNNSRLVAQLFASINGKRSSIDWILEDITEQAEIQKELQDIKRETELYRLVFNRAQDWVWIWSFDLHGKILDTSRNIKKITGYTREELIGKDDFELGLIPKKYYPSLHKEWEDRVSGKPGTANRKYEYEVIHRDGKRRFWFQANAISLKRDGKIIGDMTVASDITKQKKAEQKLIEKHKELEQHNKDMVDSIQYASRIQEAILPDIQKIKNAFHDAFVLYQPKDVVSGDYYFFYQRGSKTFVAVVDCTGHGVPGALMSFIANGILKEVIIKKGIEEPSEILYALDDELFSVLNKQNSEAITNDGMDIALAVFDSDKNTVTYSGAFRPMLLLRDNNLFEFEANRFPIGFYGDIEKTFVTKEVKLKKGDIFYLFTDGYCDQFGGEFKKKFNRKHFKELLLSIHGMEMEEQRSFLQYAFLNWRQDEPQVDDVCIVGIRL